MVEIEKSFIIKTQKGGEEIAEAFGISGGYEKTVLDIEIPDTLPQVTYITGESGCGKTTLLKELGWDGGEKTLPDGPLYTWAEDIDKAIKYMSQTGLGDATLFVSTYDELSDSQQFRAKLYHSILMDEDTIIVDEFLSTLDRKTAKSVAYVFQKIVRRLGKKLIVATAHDDLEQHLFPDMIIRGRAFPSRWSVEEHDCEITNPISNTVTIVEKDKEWYRECSLGELHYKGKYTGGVKEYRAAYYDERLVGFLISTYRMWDGGRRISRLVTHPSYRSCGVGQLLVKDYLEDFPKADVVASMAKYNPVFEKAGMVRVDDSVQRPPSGLTTDLKNAGFDKKQWYSKEYCITAMNNDKMRRVLAGYASDLSYLVCPGGEYLEDEEVKERIMSNNELAGRVCWNVRPKRMAKYVGRAAIDE